MTLRIASWNIEGRLSETNTTLRGNSGQIVKMIKKLDADLLVLLEAHGEKSLDDLNSDQPLIDMGYRIYNVPYQDDIFTRTDTKALRLSMMLLSKLPVDNFEIIRLADVRNAISATVRDRSNQSFRVFGIHLDDRAESTRLKQVADLSKTINQSTLPTIVMGDFNAMHGEDLWPAKFLRSKIVRSLANIILPIISIRATEMARGEAIKLLEESTNLIDIDPKHQPTTTPKMRGLEWLPSIRLIQIDHVFTSPDIKTLNFKIAPDGGADHRAIIATLSI